jgi:hypothetical protein
LTYAREEKGLLSGMIPAIKEERNGQSWGNSTYEKE